MGIPLEAVVRLAARHEDRQFPDVRIERSRDCRVMQIEQGLSYTGVIGGEGQRAPQDALGTAAGQGVEDFLTPFVHVVPLQVRQTRARHRIEIGRPLRRRLRVGQGGAEDYRRNGASLYDQTCHGSSPRRNVVYATPAETSLLTATGRAHHGPARPTLNRLPSSNVYEVIKLSQGGTACHC
jgi:hypothetical protein